MRYYMLLTHFRHIPDAKIDDLCLLESSFCNKEPQAFEIVIDKLNFPLGIEPPTVMTIIQSFVNQRTYRFAVRCCLHFVRQNEETPLKFYSRLCCRLEMRIRN